MEAKTKVLTILLYIQCVLKGTDLEADKISFQADFELSSVWLKQVYPDFTVLNLRNKSLIPDDISKEKAIAHRKCHLWAHYFSRQLCNELIAEQAQENLHNSLAN